MYNTLKNIKIILWYGINHTISQLLNKKWNYPSIPNTNKEFFTHTVIYESFQVFSI